MKNLIINVFAFKDNYNTSPQLGNNSKKDTIDVYMKNIFVSLKSASINNPNDEVALIVNKELEKKYLKNFEENNIKVIVIPFKKYVMPKQFKWALAFFKLCALEYVVNNLDYDKVLMLDADTVTTGALRNLWDEARYGILLYNVNHNISHKARQLIIQDYKKIYNLDDNIIQYGGEFICGTRVDLIKFMKECNNVFQAIKEINYNISHETGDEMIISIAARRYGRITDAGAYISRYWTGSFYLVSTNYYNDPVMIWHLPGEKKRGFIYLYKYYSKKKTFPNKMKMAKIFGLLKPKRPLTIIATYLIIKSKIRK